MLLARFLRDGKLPPNLPARYAPAGFHLPEHVLDAVQVHPDGGEPVNPYGLLKVVSDLSRR